MFRRMALCGKLALLVGIGFLIMGVSSIVMEVTSGEFNIHQSFGVVTLLAGIGSLFFYILKYLEVRTGENISCKFN